MLSQGNQGALPMTACRARRDNGGLGEDPPGGTMGLLIGPSDLDVQSRHVDLRYSGWFLAPFGGQLTPSYGVLPEDPPLPSPLNGAMNSLKPMTMNLQYMGLEWVPRV
jgi:hypothetical protein